MASIRKRRRADGGTSYQVRWILGGGAGRAGQSEVAETFTSRARALALAFAAEVQVEEARHQWPVNDAGARWVRGEGYVASTTPETVDTGGQAPGGPALELLVFGCGHLVTLCAC